MNEQQWQPIDDPSLDLKLDRTDHNRVTARRIKIKIPNQYIGEPIVSGLASKYEVKVNILAALLTGERQQDGWFDLQIEGRSRAIEDALSYLAELDVEIWYDSAQTDAESDHW